MRVTLVLMPPKLQRRRATALAMVCAVIATGILVQPSFLTPANAVDYPTWEEVEAAKQSEATAQSEYDRLVSALAAAREESERAASAASQAAAESAQAAADLAAAEARESRIAEQLQYAEEDLASNDNAFGSAVSWMYRDGNGLARVTELNSAESADEFMSKLSSATRSAEMWSDLAARAAEAVNTVQALEEQSTKVRQERASLAEVAEDRAQAAAVAEQEAAAAVALALERSDTIYEQLALLRDSTAETERLYLLGLEVENQNNQNPPSPPGGGGNGSGGGGGDGSIMSPAEAQAYARGAIGAYGWGEGEFSCLVSLWNGESNWRVTAENPWSGAYGIPQAWPAEKLATAGPDWRTNGATQVNWGLAYIKSAYGSPCTAWNRWQARDPHWY